MQPNKRITGRAFFTAGALALAALAMPGGKAYPAEPEARSAVADAGCATADGTQTDGNTGWRDDRSDASGPRPVRLVRGTRVEIAEIVPDGLVADLLLWIGANTSYEVAGSLRRPPTISVVGQGTRIGYEGRELDMGSTLRATYDAYSRDIYLKCPWSAADTLDRSTLLHELIHDVQYRNRYWTCHRDAEWQAYRLQTAWLEERGEQLGFNWLPAVLLSDCLKDVHP